MTAMCKKLVAEAPARLDTNTQARKPDAQLASVLARPEPVHCFVARPDASSQVEGMILSSGTQATSKRLLKAALNQQTLGHDSCPGARDK